MARAVIGASGGGAPFHGHALPVIGIIGVFDFFEECRKVDDAAWGVGKRARG